MPFLWDDMSNVVTRDKDGNALSQPIIYSGVNEWNTQKEPWNRIRSKWFIGNDPKDETLIETTQYSAWNEHCQLIPDPYDASKFFIATTDNNLQGHIRNYTWVANGEAIVNDKFGDDGEFTWNVNSTPGEWCAFQPLQYAGGDLLVTTNTDFSGKSKESELVITSASDGEEVFRIDLSNWWIRPEDAEIGGQKSSGPTDIIADERHRGMLLGSHTSCINQLINPLKGEDEEDWNVWVNGNGDFIGDKNFEEDSAKAWVCNDYDEAPYKYSASFDDYFFHIFR